ncbi:HlyC/CorC family transporter [Cellulomonas sp. zg-ZUI222]|uniref:HlyC/CorC family transporter n=1 Tax=Cellulomonas wangleii TaxID=2816956 RepID=A0ABX8D186_9CELL|nr:MULTISPECIES: hemolysin family protein [Cellulomonas]MBO0899993.1 HlyC/CorC family transporter [Cellulomonas sp. zg-ZUI22]MBO0921092.1 HlyC/CorC family transporter [Cellulomonas wangleii]MBO0925427.1 HlyC/CorC family transporter [Cellulomonas wangleii]QVI61094.1 HlyC/CorC family transporter [Cellulomonas wangleii]
MSGVPVALLLTVALLGIVLAAALSAGEVAVLRVTRARVAELEGERPGAAARVRRLVDDPARVAAAAAFVRLLGEMTATVCLTLAISAGTLSWWATALLAIAACAVVAYLLVRVSPRSMGRRHPVGVLASLSRLLLAVTALAGGVGRRADPSESTSEQDDAELRDMVERVSESDAIEDNEREMFRSVLELGDTLTREVMVPRTDMITTQADTPLHKVLALLLRSGFSRVPVVGESVDDVVGVLYLKDVVRRIPARGAHGAVHTGEDPLDAPASSLARPPVYVPESKPVDELLLELRDGSSHIALVVDEYGGIAGLVTIEDALEEIVGELTDEHDTSAPGVEDLGDGGYRVPARLGRDELGDLFGIAVEDEDVDTAAGLLAKALGKVPLPGSVGEIHGLRLQAERVEGRRKRLATVLVHRAAATDDDAPTTPARGTSAAGTPARGTPAARDHGSEAAR